MFDISHYQNLKQLSVGVSCFRNVEEVKLIGSQQLERVDIAEMSFTNQVDANIKNPNRHFSLKNCPNLKVLFIGPSSFSDFSVCEIEDVPSLEIIEIGSTIMDSSNFIHASLELRSEWHQIALTHRHAQLNAGDAWEACLQLVLARYV